jgi:hypothetical protein
MLLAAACHSNRGCDERNSLKRNEQFEQGIASEPFLRALGEQPVTATACNSSDQSSSVSFASGGPVNHTYDPNPGRMTR